MPSRNYSVSDIYNWRIGRVPLPDEWSAHMGNLAENFRMLIEGKPGHGKTEYLLQLCKVLAQHYGKVNYNNVEQGRSASLQEAMIRNKMNEIPAGRFLMAEKSQRTFKPWFARLQRPNSGRVVCLDSTDYMKLTIDEFKELHERFKQKSIVLVCWNDPFSPDAKKIRYMCDIKVDVHDFKARIRSRFGGNKTHVIWDRKEVKIQQPLFV